ncbi:MAG: hypothetical protein KKD18_04985, partial [Nanoarchaeota archaeon]|nr:hypothetical protein [Nanoarchaeota archaeon]
MKKHIVFLAVIFFIATASAAGPYDTCNFDLIPRFLKTCISPAEQIVHESFAEYEFRIKDAHPSRGPYTYHIKFISKSEATSDFPEQDITLAAGEEKTITFTVYATNLGPKHFIFQTTGGGLLSQTEAYMHYTLPPPENEDDDDNNTDTEEDNATEAEDTGEGGYVDDEPPFEEEVPENNTSQNETTSIAAFLDENFEGTGFALNKDKSDGKIIQLHIRKINQFAEGTLKIGSSHYDVSGPLTGNRLDLTIKQTNRNLKISRLTGTITAYTFFNLFTGKLIAPELNHPNDEWTVYITSPRNKGYVEVEPTEDAQEIENIKEG